MKHYFHYSTQVKVVTCAVFLLVAVLTQRLIASHLSYLTLAIGLLVCWVPLLATALLAPRYYVEDEQGVVLRLFCLQVKYSVNDYSVSHCEFAGNQAVRLFASGGLFGFWGWFYSRDMGRFMLFGTNSGTRYLKLTHARTGKVVLIQE